MSERAPLRIVATHDFCCAYPPSSTSYGSLPGGEGLKNTIDALREQGPTVRADAGDFAAPGALATLSGGEAGFAAVADLGIDVGVVGNHEFEWGVEHLRAQAPKNQAAYPSWEGEEDPLRKAARIGSATLRLPVGPGH